MITLFYVASPNVHKICVALEEMELPYKLVPVDLSKNEHRDPARVGGATNGRLPIIRDDEPIDGDDPVVTFESGAILQYLAEKTSKFLPREGRTRQEVLQWLFWQMGGLGPIGGQLFHFMAFAPQIAPDFDNSYSLSRYRNMWISLWELMNRQLEERQFLAGDYSIADMACIPWIEYLPPHDGAERYPHVVRWRDEVLARPAVKRAYERAFALETGYERNELGAQMFPMEGIIKHVIVT